jgi:hypothetical protein
MIIKHDIHLYLQVLQAVKQSYKSALAWEVRVRVMVFNSTFNISVISWLSILLVEENGVPRENHRSAASQ